jgi:shikimate dehydrogenase
VNASASGLEDDAFPVPIEALPYNAAVVDLVYRRGDTPWVRAALACGHRASDGLPMLIEQGALAFEKWFAKPAPRAVMWDAVTMPADD